MSDADQLDRHADELLDESVDETFQASDPPARSIVAALQAEAEECRGSRQRHTAPPTVFPQGDGDPGIAQSLPWHDS